MTTEEGGAFWERMEGETATAYAAFCAYRDMGRTRSLRRAAAVFYAPDKGDHKEAAGSPDIGTSGQVSRFKAWSSANMWQARVEAFDAEEARARSLRLQDERDRQLDDHLRLSKLGVKAAAQVLFRIIRDGGEIPAGSLPALMTASTQIGRLALGESTARVESQGADEQAADFSRLTDEEITLLDELGEKLYGGG